MDTPEEKKIQRRLFIYCLYTKTKKLDPAAGAGHVWFTMRELVEISKKIGLAQDEEGTQSEVRYLDAKRLLEYRERDGRVSITQDGIEQVLNIQEPLDRSPSVSTNNIINISAPVNAIQQGTQSSTQVVSFDTNDLAQIRELVSDILSHRNEFPEEHRSDLEADINTVQAQLAKQSPNSSIIRESLGSMRRVLEAASGAIIANAVNALPLADWLNTIDNIIKFAS